MNAEARAGRGIVGESSVAYIGPAELFMSLTDDTENARMRKFFGHTGPTRIMVESRAPEYNLLGDRIQSDANRFPP
jgi:hypothetical protein